MPTPTAATPRTINRYTYLGTTDEVDACDCCGKGDLKVTVAIHDDEQGDTLYFGTTCAARALRVKVAEVKTGTARADRAKAEAAAAAAREIAEAKHRADLAVYVEWLRTTYIVPALQQPADLLELAGVKPWDAHKRYREEVAPQGAPPHAWTK
jgi:hypothetical protein